MMWGSEGLKLKILPCKKWLKSIQSAKKCALQKQICAKEVYHETKSKLLMLPLLLIEIKGIWKVFS
jgi:hypothetical protein